MAEPMILRGQAAKDFMCFLIYGDKETDAKRYAFLKECMELEVEVKEDGSITLKDPNLDMEEIKAILEEEK